MRGIVCMGILCLLMGGCNPKDEKKRNSPEEPDWSYAQNFYYQNMTEAIGLMDSLAAVSPDSETAKSLFIAVRRAFKKAEPYASYLNPQVGHRANGPALPVFLEDTERVMEPIGLQKIEESIYEGGVSESVFRKEVLLTKGLFVNLQKYISKRRLNSQRFFIATHQQLFRIVSLAIVGFDTPISHLGLKETIVSLESLRDVYNHSLRSLIEADSPQLDNEFQSHLDAAVSFILANPDFEAFDRFTFIRDYMNAITRDWVAIRKQSGLWEGVNNKPFNFDAPTFFETNSFNSAYFIPPANRNTSEIQIALGEKLFFDPNLSQGSVMACATCHIPEKAYADGLVVNKDNRGKRLKRNTPTLLNAVFSQSFFWDGRSESLEDQITSVFTNEQEFNAGVHQFSSEILKDSTYIPLFEDAFGGISSRNTNVIRAISSYISTLNGFNSKFDRNIRGEEDNFTAEEKRGFNLYMGKALCATCHFIPLTNGTVPPFFTETEKEVIGVPETAANKELDDDLGFYWRWGKEIHRGMFKTPTIRNAELTAPYMHNGVYSTLEEVMDFYNKGGGGGLGFDLKHQTLPFDELNFTQEELNALIAFMKTLSDPKTNY